MALSLEDVVALTLEDVVRGPFVFFVSSAVLDPAELRLYACFVRHQHFLLGCKEPMIPTDREAWREYGVD